MADVNSLITIKVKKESREYCFTMQAGSPAGEAYDSCFEVLSELLKIATQLVQKAENKKPNEEIAE